MQVEETPYGERGTGLVPAPLNARSLRYRLIPDPTAVTVDWNAAPSLWSWMPEEILDQQQEGSCVAQTVALCTYLLRRQRGLDQRWVNRNYDYFWGRVKAGLIDADNPATWQDTGMWAEAGYDVILDGYPNEALDPYQANAHRRPPDSLAADKQNQDDLLSHRGIFRDDPGGLAGGVIIALQAQMPVAIGMMWHSSYNNPDNRGFLPNVSAVGSQSAHEVTCYKRIPQGAIGPDWYAACRNSWGRMYTQGRRFADREMQPGDFLIPGKRFTDGTVIDVRAASMELVPLPPEPPPSAKLYNIQYQHTGDGGRSWQVVYSSEAEPLRPGLNVYGIVERGMDGSNPGWAGEVVIRDAPFNTPQARVTDGRDIPIAGDGKRTG